MASDDKLPESLSSFDYVRFTWADIHGIPRGKSIPARHVTRHWKDGLHAYAGSLAFGPRSEYMDFPELSSTGCGNLIARAVPDTLHSLPWAAQPDVQVGEVLAECSWADGQRHCACTRSIARLQLEQLQQEFDLQIKTGFEFEFVVFHADSGEPVFRGIDIFAHQLLSEFEDYLYDVDRHLYKAGVDIESFITEYCHGQFELATAPLSGLAGLDKAFIFKEGVKEISRKRGYQATFMTKPFLQGNGNGCHMNLSLWNSAGLNVFHDSSAPNNMSSTFEHWLAGLIHHAPALTALCSPTVNCYHRLHKPWSPHQANWGMDNRLSAFRVKASSPSGTLVENRIPTSAANPYLALAACVAAGLDGLRNKLPLPASMDTSAKVLPASLAEALEELEKDQVICEALGQQLIQWFLKEKRTMEIEKLTDPELSDEEKLDREK